MNPSVSFSCLLTLARILTIMLNRNCKSKHIYHTPDHRGKMFSPEPLSMLISCEIFFFLHSFLFICLPVLFIIESIKFCEILFLCLLRWSCVFVISSSNRVYYIIWFSYVEPTLNFQYKSHLLWCAVIFIQYWIWLASISLRIWGSVFITVTDV